MTDTLGTKHAKTSTSNEFVLQLKQRQIGWLLSTIPVTRHRCIQIAEGSIAPGENNTVGTEVVTVETGGGSLQEWEETYKNGKNRTSIGGEQTSRLLIFLLPSLQMNLATRPPGECNETAPYVIEFSNNNRMIPEAHINDGEA